MKQKGESTKKSVDSTLTGTPNKQFEVKVVVCAKNITSARQQAKAAFRGNKTIEVHEVVNLADTAAVRLEGADYDSGIAKVVVEQEREKLENWRDTLPQTAAEEREQAEAAINVLDEIYEHLDTVEWSLFPSLELPQSYS